MKFRILLVLLFSTFSAHALEDSIENRLEQTERYMTSTPPEEIMQDMANNMAMNMPPEERQQFRELLINYVNIDTLTDVMKASMVKTFTADELAALADFYEQPIAKSVMQKMGIYMAEVMPTIQAEVLIAIAEMEKAKANQNRILPDTEGE